MRPSELCKLPMWNPRSLPSPLLIFQASLLGELLTGKGALAQLNIETGIPLSEIDPILGFFIVALGVAAVSPASGKFITDDDLE